MLPVAWYKGEMNAGAQTPEELEMLLEDSLLLRDPESLMKLFVDGAVLVVDEEASVRGKEIARLALATWNNNHTYIADPRRVIQMRDIALVISMQSINVMHRDSNGRWQYVIISLSVDLGWNLQEDNTRISSPR